MTIEAKRAAVLARLLPDRSDWRVLWTEAEVLVLVDEVIRLAEAGPPPQETPSVPTDVELEARAMLLAVRGVVSAGVVAAMLKDVRDQTRRAIEGRNRQ